MKLKKKTPTDVALEFVDCINRGDLGALLALTTRDHQLEVFDEEPVVGREANARAWRVYMTSYPSYRVHPRQVIAEGNVVAILGHTTGSHLGLADEEESRLPLIWVVHVQDDAVQRFRLIEDLPESRAKYGLTGSP